MENESKSPSMHPILKIDLSNKEDIFEGDEAKTILGTPVERSVDMADDIFWMPDLVDEESC